MPVNQAEKRFFGLLRANKPKMDLLPDLSKARAMTKVIFKEYAGKTAAVPFNKTLIKGRDGEDIGIQIFNPDAKGPTLFFLPGNAFLFDLFECHTIAASRIAHFGKFKVIVIDYRLMPENPWPTAINDIEDVLTDMYQNSHLYNIDQKSVYLSGICSGAHAAALVSLRKNHAFTIQKLILLNGLYDQSLSQNAYATFEQEDEMIVRSACSWWLDHYKISSEKAKSPNYSPLYAKDFSELPNVAIIVGEHDGFRSDSEAFYLKLQEHHIPVSKTVIPSQTHNTMIMRGVMTEGPDPAEILAKSVLGY